MSRVPKMGEVWTMPDGTPYTCVDEVPDDTGDYGWSFPYADQTLKEYDGLQHLTPPKAEPPEWLKGYPWARVSPSAVHGGYSSPDRAVAIVDALGALNVLTGEWVPRD